MRAQANQSAPSGVGATAHSTVKPCDCTPSLAAVTIVSTPPNRRRQLPISSNKVSEVRLIRGVRLPAQQARVCIAAVSRDELRGMRVIDGSSMRAAATPVPLSTPACSAALSARRMRPCSTIALGEGKGALASSEREGRWSASHSEFIVFMQFEWSLNLKVERPAAGWSTSLEQIDPQRSLRPR